MADPSFYPRFATERLSEALADSPAALIHGPRQSGKTTLTQRVGARAGYAYLSFDDEAIRSAATADPVGQTTPENVLMHLKKIYADGELEKRATAKDFLAVRTEGKRQVQRRLKHYNLDAIISVNHPFVDDNKRIGSLLFVDLRRATRT